MNFPHTPQTPSVIVDPAPRRLVRRHKIETAIACLIYVILTIALFFAASCSIPVRVEPERTADNLIVPVPVYQVNPAPSATAGILAGYVDPERVVRPPEVGWGDWFDVALGALGALVPAAAGLTALAIKLRKQFAATTIAADLADANEEAAINAAPPEKKEAVREAIGWNKAVAASRQEATGSKQATAKARQTRKRSVPTA